MESEQRDELNGVQCMSVSEKTHDLPARTQSASEHNSSKKKFFGVGGMCDFRMF